MRLIDADKIIITRQDYVGALTLPERLRRLLNIQPTVKAIPIEWMKKYELAKGQEVRLQDAINEWEKEHGQ